MHGDGPPRLLHDAWTYCGAAVRAGDLAKVRAGPGATLRWIDLKMGAVLLTLQAPATAS